MVDHFKPDVILLDLKFITSTVIEALKEFQHIKVVLFGQGIPKGLRVSAVVASPTSSVVIRRNLEDDTHKTLYLYDSANVVDIFNGPASNTFNADLAYFYSRQDKDTYVDQIKLLAYASQICKVKIVGPVRINLPCYLGTITYEGLSAIYRDATFTLDYNTDQFLDIIANGGCPVTKIPTKQRICPHYQNHQDLYSIVKEGRTELINDSLRLGQIGILTNDTCYNRLAEIMRAIDENDYSDEILGKLKERTECVLAS
jgi:hypothetical protein